MGSRRERLITEPKKHVMVDFNPLRSFYDPKATLELGLSCSASKEGDTTFNRQISSRGVEQARRPSMYRRARASLGFACRARFRALASGADVLRLVRPWTSSRTKQ